MGYVLVVWIYLCAGVGVLNMYLYLFFLCLFMYWGGGWQQELYKFFLVGQVLFTLYDSCFFTISSPTMNLLITFYQNFKVFLYMCKLLKISKSVGIYCG